MFYHKVYMNQIHSSSLLCQLASMWKNQVLCDAVIKAGNSHIKAHRVVLVAACPMLHSMKNASVGSNLEVRLAADIKPEAINTFLQYLYEGFMMLTEENCKDVEKIARVLQVDSILKCCADFYKCLHTGEKYEYSFHDNVEFRHVRASDLLKVHDRSKRASDLQPASPGIKRQRIQSRGGSDSFGDYGASDPWDRVPREYSGSSSARTTQPGVIEIMEDSVEIVHSDKPEDSGGTRRDNLQDRMSLSVASQLKSTNDVQIINVSSGGDASQRVSNSSDSSRFSSHPTFTHSQGSSNMSFRHDPSFPNPSSTSSTRLPSSPSPHSRMPSPSSAYHPQQRNTTAHSQPKPFAAGNATQASKSYNTPSPVEQLRPGSQDQSRVTAGASTVSFSSPSSSLGAPPASSPSTSTQPPQPVALWRSTSSDAVASGPAPVPQLTEKPLLQRSESTPATTGADISIVKVESEVTFDEQFHGDDPNITFDPEDQSGDWNREDTSNEESNASEDKMPQWMAESLKAYRSDEDRPSSSGEEPAAGRSKLSEYIDKLHDLQTKAMYFDMMRNRPKISIPVEASEVTESADTSEVLKGLDLTIRSSQQKHVPIYNKDRKYTPCLYCGRLKNRTRSGWRVNTFYRCLQCDVPLCVNDRNCFVLYHKYFLGMSNVESPGRRRSRDLSHLEVKKETNG